MHPRTSQVASGSQGSFCHLSYNPCALVVRTHTMQYVSLYAFMAAHLPHSSFQGMRRRGFAPRRSSKYESACLRKSPPPIPAGRPGAWALALAALTLGACGQPDEQPPYSPSEALETFRIEEGFRIDLVAAEPLVMDPVAMDIDEHGRIFVAEMPGYPLDVGGTGRIKLLHDTDGDGQPDEATVFADGLRLPTGLMRWKEGVLVTDPPELLYFADTTGDGVADFSEAVVTGFALSNAQHNANTPVYGLDNWIYIANNAPISRTTRFADPFGDAGSPIHYPGHPEAPRLPRNGADRNVRLSPDQLVLESLSSRSQFGQTFDAWGRHFLVDNSHHHMHEVIPARGVPAARFAAPTDVVHFTPGHGNAAVVYPITINPEHQLLTDRGVFTSACGLTYYLGGLFPEPFAGSVTFVAEPVHNLIHVDRVVPDGVTFAAQRMHEGREFLASTDSWFRPVNFSLGPDGALYVVDYYRQIVEHPEWMDDSLATHADLTRGTRMGRLYRVVPEGTPAMDWHGAVDLGDTRSLVNHLTSANAWQRMTAQRLLVGQKDPDAAPLLAALFAETPSPLGRLHALWTLEGLGQLPDSLLRAALADEHPGIRENATRIAATRASLRSDLVPLARDTDARVRFEVLMALSAARDSPAADALYELVWRDLESPWVQRVALMALDEAPQDLIDRAQRRRELSADVIAGFLEEIARVAALQQEAGDVSQLIVDNLDSAPVLRGIARALGQRTIEGLSAPVEALARRALEGGRAAADVLEQLDFPGGFAYAARAATVMQDRRLPASQRVQAAKLVGLGGEYGLLLARIALSDDSLAVRAGALRALQRVPGTAPAEVLLQDWSRLTPDLRREALLVFRTQERAALLVEALESAQVQPSEIPWNIRVRLMRDTAEPVRSAARALLQLSAVTTMPEVPPNAGDPDRGRDIFLARCASCHRAGSLGAGTLGPDLGTVRHWSRGALIDKIARPERSVASGYEQWAVTLTDGRQVQGIVQSESAGTLTIATVDALVTLSRDEIASMEAVPTSLMPADLLTGLTDVAIADLLSFLTDH